MEDFWSYRFTAEELSLDFYNFLVAFLDQNPSYKGRAIYLSGESYAGHYIPVFAKYIAE